jgi:glycosyltransferase involved in cell wall biosynthesis
MTAPRVSVIIPCRNESEFIEQLLDAIHAQTRRPDEIIVSDNGSTDDSLAVVTAYAARRPEIPLRVVRSDDEGAGAAMNAGIKVAAGDVIVRLDGHSAPNPEYIARALQHLDEPRAGVVGGVWEISPGGLSLRSHAIALAVGSDLGSGGAIYRHADRARIRDVDTVPFGCYRRELWQRLGGYNHTLLVVEDGELNYRVRKAGLRVILDPGMRSTYFPRRRFRTLARQYFRYGWWKMPFLLEHPGAARVRQLIPLAFVVLCLALAFASAVLPGARMPLFVLLAVYGAVLLAAALKPAIRSRDLRLWPLIAAAFAIVHFAWGLGAVLYLLSFGSVPPWRLHPRATRL